MKRHRPNHSDPAATAGKRHPHRKNPMLAHPLKIVGGLLAAGLLACAPAHAANGNASASLKNIKFQLIDLDLTDNISPSIDFFSTSASGYLSFFSSDPGIDETGYSNRFETVNKPFTYGGASTHNGPTSMRSEMHINTSLPEWTSFVSTNQRLHFTLSPSTRLLFSAEAEVFVQDNGIKDTAANATLGGGFETTIDGVRGYESFSTTLSTSAGARSELLLGVLDTGAAIGTGVLAAGTSASFYTDQNTSPVPEPETYGMLLAGLLVLGGVARGKRRGQARKA